MYYHYTNRSGAKAINQSGYIQPSEESGYFGPGVYLTDLDPNDFFRDEILKNNYGGIQSNFHDRADWVVQVCQHNNDMQLLRRVQVDSDRRIFVYPNAISISADHIYDKPRCLKDCVVVAEDDAASSIDEDDQYYDSADDVNGSDEFDMDDGLGYDGNGESEETDPMDDTGSYLIEVEVNGYSECDSDEYEGSCGDDECCYSGDAEDYGSDGSGEDCGSDVSEEYYGGGGTGGGEESQCDSQDADGYRSDGNGEVCDEEVCDEDDEEYGSDGSEEVCDEDEYYASDDYDCDNNNGYSDGHSDSYGESDGGSY